MPLEGGVFIVPTHSDPHPTTDLGVSQLIADPWSLTRHLVAATGRPAVRVSDIDASTGQATNSYARSRRITSSEPDSPWAIHLTDVEHQFRYLCFDLDAKEHDSVADASVLADLLDQISVDYVVCRSSDSNGGRGRHVWLGLRDGVDAHTVRQLARVARAALPSLDLSPLSNAVTGAVRPPGAPHRDGSVSTVLAGDLAALTHPTTADSDVRALFEMLVDAAQLTPAQIQSSVDEQPSVAPIATAFDSAGHLYLVNGTRMMSERGDQMLSSGDVGDDASAKLASALTRMAKAGYRFADARQLVDSSPVFEHLRSEAVKGSTRRVRRDPRTVESMLARQWRRAVTWVATRSDSYTAEDSTFADRALHVATVVEAAQERADASPGRWKSAGDLSPRYFVRGGYSDRMVLDALCLLVVQSTKQSVEASTRHLSAMTGLGRESCRTALLRLTAEGWVCQTREADGVRAAFWRLTEFSTVRENQDRSQVPPPPPRRAGPMLRSEWISKLSDRLNGLAHDVFAAPGSLGRTAGRVFAHLTTGTPCNSQDVAERSGLRESLVRRALRRLRQNRIVTVRKDLWAARVHDGRELAAMRLRVHGFLERRRHAYEVERQAWVWWCYELSVWTTEKTRRPRRKRGALQLVLFHVAGAPPDFPMHPRRANGLMDWKAARRAVAKGVLSDDGRFSEAA